MRLRPLMMWLHLPVLYHSVFILLITSSTVDGQPRLQLHPSQPTVLSGSTVGFNCTIAENLRHLIDSSKLTMVFGGNSSASSSHNGNRTTSVSIIDDWTLNLRIANIRRQDSGLMVICSTNVTVDGQRIFYSTSVIVADKPVKPVVTQCIVANWKSMACYWEPAVQDTGIQSNQTLWWKITQTLEDTQYHPCPHAIRAGVCQWSTEGSFKLGFPYVVVVQAANALGLSQSLQKQFSTDHIVKPDPVLRLAWTNIESQSALVTWDVPYVSDYDKHVNYRLVYTSEWQTDTINTTNTSVTLESLIPFVRYTVTVDCIPLVPSVGSDLLEASGYWSEPRSIVQTTLSDVPGQAPSVTPGAYEWVHDTDGHLRLKVYWQPVHPRWSHGKIVGSRISFREVHLDGLASSEQWKMEESNSSETWKVLEASGLFPDRDYELKVEARTTVGYNTSLNLDSLFIPSSKLAPGKPQSFVAFGEASNVSMNWEAVENADRYTVYWCQPIVHTVHCRPDRKPFWEYVPGNETNTTVSVGINYDSWIFAVSAERHTGTSSAGQLDNNVYISSGLVWSPCTFNAKNTVKPPNDVSFAGHQLGESLTIDWKPPRCEETNVISHYIVAVCRISTDCRSLPPKDWELKKFAGMTTASVKLNDLVADEDYYVAVRSFSYKGLSEFTPTMKKRVLRIGLARGAIAGIVVASIFAFVITVLGLITVIKKCGKWGKNAARVPITCPVPNVYVSPPTPKNPLNGSYAHLSDNVEMMETSPMMDEYRRQNGRQNEQTSGKDTKPFATDDDTPLFNDEVPTNSSMPDVTPDDRISAYTKPYLDGPDVVGYYGNGGNKTVTDHAVPSTNERAALESTAPVPTIAATILPPIATTSGSQYTDMPYVAMPAISPYSLVEQQSAIELPSYSTQPTISSQPTLGSEPPHVRQEPSTAPDHSLNPADTTLPGSTEISRVPDIDAQNSAVPEIPVAADDEPNRASNAPIDGYVTVPWLSNSTE